MKRRKLFHIFITSVILACSLGTSAYATELEDEDLPISFRLEMLSWEKANEIIPNKAIFTIIDVETGFQFRAQRRAGNKHADVQPLTKEDTQIMKKIFHEKWSWKRRAIIIQVNDQFIAASMHGMPHGAGALKNNFPGHFCVHFFGSTTHGSKHEDLSHKIMILKAAGKIEEYLNQVNPYELIQIFAVSVNNDDDNLLDLIISNEHNSEQLHGVVKELEYLRIRNTSLLSLEDINGLTLVEIPVQIDMLKKGGKTEKRLLHFIIRRDSLIDRWKIDGNYLYKEL
jgi:hypothetical protein